MGADRGRNPPHDRASSAGLSTSRAAAGLHARRRRRPCGGAVHSILNRPAHTPGIPSHTQPPPPPTGRRGRHRGRGSVLLGLVVGGRLLLAHHLGEGVEEGAGDGDGGADHRVALHHLAEDDGGDDDDDDALEGVEHRRRHRAHLGGEGEGELVVEVEGDARRDGVEDDVVGRRRALLDRVVPLVLDGAGLLVDDGDEGPHRRDDVHHRVHVGRVHVLGLVRLEAVGDVLAELALEGRHEVSEGGPAEGEHVDLDALALLDAGEADAANNDEEHHVGEEWLRLDGGHCKRHNSGENRLARLHDLSEGHRAATKSKH
mmetsp:Transcript_31044/g.65093  ORF Transcript_31044/g.65093 Transcript_31044/m.65093 type:complete len:316 (+) Transcript_31044:173-1120(+)